MFRRWLSKVLSTVPFIGNITRMMYDTGYSNNRFVTTRFLPFKVDDGKISGMVLVPSEIKRYAARKSVYSKPVHLASKCGIFMKNTVVQLSTTKNKKLTMRDFYVGYVYMDNQLMQLFMSEANLYAATQRFETLKDKLNFKLSFQQKLALWLAKLQKAVFEVYTK